MQRLDLVVKHQLAYKILMIIRKIIPLYRRLWLPSIPPYWKAAVNKQQLQIQEARGNLLYYVLRSFLTMNHCDFLCGLTIKELRASSVLT